MSDEAMDALERVKAEITRGEHRLILNAMRRKKNGFEDETVSFVSGVTEMAEVALQIVYEEIRDLACEEIDNDDF